MLPVLCPITNLSSDTKLPQTIIYKSSLELSQENREILLNRKNAVDMYIDGVNVTTIEEETRIDKATINKFVAKCCKINPITNEL
ncbi:MAG: hypothetical protein K0S47_1675 [Herbinix sp.]|jgi:hypothetical protein|nr:hypothetical protein [Herbinix sp.]